MTLNQMEEIPRQDEPGAVALIGNFLSQKGRSRCVCEELALRLSAAGWKVITASNRRLRPLRLLDMVRTACERRREYDVALVEVYSGLAFVWAEVVAAVLRGLRKPYVLALHGGSLPGFAQRCPKRVQRLLHSTPIVTAPSAYLLQQMAPYCPGLRLVPNALEISRYPFHLREDPKPSLMWLRIFHELYNPSLGPKVLAFLQTEFAQAHLTMVGADKKDGSLERVQQTAKALGVLEQMWLPGGVPKEEVPAWLNRGDIFLNTTNADNTPVSVLEAMACGLCVVSTNVGGLPYLLQHGRDALLVPPNDVEAMAAAVRRILTDPGLAARLSRNGRVKAEACDWKLVLPKWEKLLVQASHPQPSQSPEQMNPNARTKHDVVSSAA